MYSINNQKFYDLKIDVIKCKKCFTIYAEMPGILKNDIKINVIGYFMVIEGVKKKFFSAKDTKYLHDECPYGKFKKYIALPNDVDKHNISYKLNNGILLIKMDKKNLLCHTEGIKHFI